LYTDFAINGRATMQSKAKCVQSTSVRGALHCWGMTNTEGTTIKPRFAPIRRLLGFLMLAGLALAACSRTSERGGTGTGGAGPEQSSRPRIAVIPKGTTHEFWKSVHAGAVKAARELAVDVIWKGPLKEDDLKSQIDLVQSFTAQKISGIVLAPLNDKALVASVNGAAQAGVPVVIFDSALAGGDITSFVATDNRAAGALAAARMAKLLPGSGKVVVLRYQEGSASTHDREEGFLAGLKEQPGLQVVSANQYGGATTESAFNAAESVLLAQNAAGGGVNAVFTPNESTTFGMLLALQKTKLAGKLEFIGFDASDKLVKAVGDGEIDALVLQNPFNMGYLAVHAVVDRLHGKPVPARTDTGAQLLDRENRDQPSLQELLKPDLAKWLGP
jgi:ribose transport system substrate-binding protein